MQIAVIGGGGAGLVTAWLLENEHQVTVFEKQGRLGGHADTVRVDLQDGSFLVDAGFGFYSVEMFPVFTRLLKVLEVPLQTYPVTATFYTTDHRRVVLLPPLRSARTLWTGLQPGNLRDLLRFRTVLRAARELMADRDTTVTLEAFIEGLSLPLNFKEEFLYPFLLAGWCVEPEEYRGFMAYNALRYVYMHQPAGLAPFHWLQITGGTQIYIQALVGTLAQTQIVQNTEIRSVEKTEGGYKLVDDAGNRWFAEAVVFAGSAYDMARILERSALHPPALAPLNRVEYTQTKIAIHGDRRLMPANEHHWSVVNIRYDGHYASNSVWKSQVLGGRPVFKSWITYEEQLPEPLYFLRTYWHPKVNAAYFQAQREIRALQGQDRFWFAGVHTHDVDCHESAVLSGVHIAQELAPGSERLQALMGPAG